MKPLILSFILCIAVTASNAQQTSLYNKDGEATAYIDYDKKATIFLWNGTPVAFLQKELNDTCIIGFNGSFIAWYKDGIVYDKEGLAAGVKKGVQRMLLLHKNEKIKGVQKIVPVKPVIPMVPVQPVFRSSWGNTGLEELLSAGKK
jgi:hypothetical protein